MERYRQQPGDPKQRFTLSTKTALRRLNEVAFSESTAKVYLILYGLFFLFLYMYTVGRHGYVVVIVELAILAICYYLDQGPKTNKADFLFRYAYSTFVVSAHYALWAAIIWAVFSAAGWAFSEFVQTFELYGFVIDANRFRDVKYAFLIVVALQFLRRRFWIHKRITSMTPAIFKDDAFPIPWDRIKTTLKKTATHLKLGFGDLTERFNKSDKVRCPHCSHRQKPGEEYCGNCGKKMPPPTKPCPTCNAENPYGNKYCVACGHSFFQGEKES